MPTPPYPVLETPVKRSWLDCHGHWKIALGALMAIVLIGGYMAVVFASVEASFRRSVVYQEALTRAGRNSQVIDRIGTPLKAARVLQGKLNTSGSNGTARMTIPVSGPRGKGTIYVDAREVSGNWEFLALQLRFEGQPDCLNLLEDASATAVCCSR
jgi:Cytochrome oxidase complex assembly protein 1